MRKTFILDTSALVTDPSCFKSFPESDVIIPIVVLGELDKLKKQSGDTGRKARVCIRLIDEISSTGNINDGIRLDSDILLKVDSTYRDLHKEPYSHLGEPEYGDTSILACAIDYFKILEKDSVTLVSNDLNLKIKAKGHGLLAQSHEESNLSLTDLFVGAQTLIDEGAGQDLQEFNAIDPKEYDIVIKQNECIAFENEDGDTIALGRMGKELIKPLKRWYPWDLSARNREQSFAIDLLMDRNIDLVTLIGKAGTGKSLIALACAMDLVINRKEFDKLIIYRPVQEVGNPIGFLPGTLEEKLAPWMQPIMDNFEVLLSKKNSKNQEGWKRELEALQKKGKVEMEAITFIRGRSIPNAIILIDEAQNLKKDDIKTILTRAGEGTKIILTGDIEQIDNRDLDALNNGLTYTIEKFKEFDIAGHITLTKGERSKLATKAADIL